MSAAEIVIFSGRTKKKWWHAIKEAMQSSGEGNEEIHRAGVGSFARLFVSPPSLSLSLSLSSRFIFFHPFFVVVHLSISFSDSLSHLAPLLMFSSMEFFFLLSAVFIVCFICVSCGVALFVLFCFGVTDES